MQSTRVLRIRHDLACPSSFLDHLVPLQGKRHQTNIARRAARDAYEAQQASAAPTSVVKNARKTVKIGRPGYRVTKQKCPETGQRSLLFLIDYPEIEEGLQPRHRFMSAYEQKVEPVDKKFQYILVAAEPYETIAFKVPNRYPPAPHHRLAKRVVALGCLFDVPRQSSITKPLVQPRGGGSSSCMRTPAPLLGLISSVVSSHLVFSDARVFCLCARREIDTAANKFFTNWDRDNLTFTLQIHFRDKKIGDMPPPPPPPLNGFPGAGGPASGPPRPPPQ